ncbi:peptide deformylase [Caloramator quimbayensis]|uniref:Peptide deformylase n=1 Tax=Caloramator quimbayensis TaxID=1147123 RepID=A0A1T4XS83_9CLOT|nr:peptide deformylase [Caloramator quimbayensis]SKA92422.1 peptide deformylase [Caloramator quimbayensis]
MALREIRKMGDEILRKKSRKVDKVDDKIKMLLEDMVETMRHNNGVGLAAPQVGILKRVAVVDIGEGLYKLVNPEIINSEGSQIDIEGCLSIPNVRDNVERPKKVVVKALNENGEEIIIEGEDFLARALCHEIDHLDGILFVDKVKRDGGNI